VIPRGKEIPTHTTHGEITVQCVEGRVAFTTGGVTHEIGAGQLLYLHGEQPHSILGIDDASLLMTITFPRYSPPAQRLTHS
jgi:quercetin dioxygenase-like cupin family protein